MGRRKKVGDIYAIPLPNGRYAFARLLRDLNVGIYDHLGESANDIPETDDYRFIVGVYKFAINEWQFVMHRPFSCDEDEYPPPRCVVDIISKQYYLYDKGVMTLSDKETCGGLERVAAWDNAQLIDRIMGNNKWQDSFPKIN